MDTATARLFLRDSQDEPLFRSMINLHVNSKQHSFKDATNLYFKVVCD